MPAAWIACNSHKIPFRNDHGQIYHFIDRQDIQAVSQPRKVDVRPADVSRTYRSDGGDEVLSFSKTTARYPFVLLVR